MRQLVVDLSGLTFLDSSGLRLLIELAADADRDGFTLGLVPGPPVVQRVFEVSGMRALLPFSDA